MTTRRGRILRIWLLLIVVLTGLFAFDRTNTAAIATSTDNSYIHVALPSTSSLIDRLSDAEVRAKGLRYEHPARVLKLPGGGSATVFVADGVTDTLPVPPEGFDPLTATDAELLTYAFPLRPRDNRGLALWKSQMSRLARTWPTSRIVEVPNRHAATSPDNPIWAGYQTTAAGPPLSNAARFKQAIGDYVVPETFGACPGLADTVAHWVGISDSAGILQAGTVYGHGDSYDSPVEQAGWFEAYPQEALKLAGIDIPAGDTVQVAITDLVPVTGEKAFDWSIEDMRTGSFKNGKESYSFVNEDNEVDYIAERVTVGKTASELSHYQDTPWSSISYVDYFGDVDIMGVSVATNPITMVGASGTLAFASPYYNPPSGGSQFTDIWVNCL